VAGTITVAHGLRNLSGDYERVAWKTTEDLADALDEHEANMEEQGWWSPHVFRGARDGKNWVQASCLAIDIDGPTKKDKQPLPDVLREQLEQLFDVGNAPGSVWHVTHSGFRAVFALRSPTRSREAWLKAHAGARVMCERWLRQQGLDGFVVDKAVANLANLNWLPNTTDEKGRSRTASCFHHERTFTVAELGQVEPDAHVPDQSVEQPEGNARDKRKALDALLMLGPKVAEEYETWIEVGQVLHVVYGGKQAGLDAWHAWSKQTDNYDARALDKRWAGFKPGGRGLGSLVFLAKSEGHPHAWEGGIEELHELGLRTQGATLTPVPPPEPDEDWIERVEAREESEAPSASRTFRDARYVSPSRAGWHLAW